MGEQHFNTVSEIAVWRSEKIEVELAKTTIETMLFLNSTHIFFSEIKFKIIYLQFLVCENKKCLIKMFEDYFFYSNFSREAYVFPNNEQHLKDNVNLFIKSERCVEI